MSSIWRINSSISHAVFRSYSADPLATGVRDSSK
ncbi:hypothetical protein T4A_2735 [Trichinella pseudospiralis]|uniref:Uncharacterized protein n=1 Tax=Trichinella pseudospiralis TaxID=6337 RepID=A0A0V1ALH8_TRIPS|nr:hypothetical protein T4A_2735 [Trichinella pseudospiralis]